MKMRWSEIVIRKNRKKRVGENNWRNKRKLITSLNLFGTRRILESIQMPPKPIFRKL